MATANVYKPKNSPFWYYEFQIKDRRFRASTGCKTKREAIAVAKQEKVRIERDVEAEVAESSGKVSLKLQDAVWRYWREKGETHTGADNTWRDLVRLVVYFDKIRHLPEKERMDPAAFEKARREFESKGDDAAGKTTLLTEIKGPDVAALVVWRRAQRAVPHNLPKDRKREDYPLIANATVNRSTTEVLKKLVTHAKRVWHVNFPEEPIWSAHLLEEPEEIARELMDDEGERLEAQMRADYLPFFAFAKLSGLRREQCIALLWRHVNFKEGVIKMPGKGGREEIVRLTQELRAILEPLRGHHRELVFTYVCARSRRARKAGETYARTTKGKTGESFVAEREQAERVKGRRYPLTKEGVKSAWARLREKAGVDDFRFHDYRHNFGTKAARACGGNLKMVQRLMNHRDQKSTWRYVRVAEKELAEATEAVHRAMQGGHAEAAPETEAAHEVPILSPHSKASNAA